MAAPALRPPRTRPSRSSPRSSPSCSDLLGAGEKLLVHQDELGDRVQGLMAGFLRWAGMIDGRPQAVTVIERLLGRQLGPVRARAGGHRARPSPAAT